MFGPANKGYQALYIGMMCGVRIIVEAFPVIAWTALHREPCQGGPVVPAMKKMLKLDELIVVDRHRGVHVSE